MTSTPETSRVAEEVGIVCPIEPHELERAHRRGMDNIVRRVLAASVVKGQGADLFLRVYLAGMYHGLKLDRQQGNPQ